MRDRTWKQSRIEIKQTSGGICTGKKLYAEPYKFPRIICVKCLNDFLEMFMVASMCITCSELMINEI